jgi:hypothetical protein
VDEAAFASVDFTEQQPAESKAEARTRGTEKSTGLTISFAKEHNCST